MTLTKRTCRIVYTRQKVWDICFHEAGHAVAAVRLGLGVKSRERWCRRRSGIWYRRKVGVKIATHYKGNRHLGGFQRWGGSVMTERRGPKEDEAIFLQAGIVAELLFNPRPTETEGWDFDRECFKNVMSVEGMEFMNLWTELELTTRKFVLDNWRSVTALAQALMRQKHHSLSRQRIIRIIDRSSA